MPPIRQTTRPPTHTLRLPAGRLPFAAFQGSSDSGPLSRNLGKSLNLIGTSVIYKHVLWRLGNKSVASIRRTFLVGLFSSFLLTNHSAQNANRSVINEAFVELTSRTSTRATQV